MFVYELILRKGDERMTVKKRSFKLLAALLAIFTVLAGYPVAALAGEETRFEAVCIYDEENDCEYGEKYSDMVFDGPVTVEAAEGLYRSYVEFENCTFNDGLTVYTAGEVFVTFGGGCVINKDEGYDVTVIGTDYEALAEGGCRAEFFNAPADTYFGSVDSRIFANSDTEQMCSLEKFDDFHFYIDGVEMTAGMPGFRFGTDVYFSEDGSFRKNIFVSSASEVIADNCFFNDFVIEIPDVVPGEGEEAF